MTDSPHRSPAGWGEQSPSDHPGNADPAYASQAPHGVPYQPATGPAPTKRLPAYSRYEGNYDNRGSQHRGIPPQSDGAATTGPTGSPPRRWLWVLAIASVLVVIGLVVALVIVSSAERGTVVPAPTLEPTSTPRTTAPSRPRTTPRRTPTAPPLPLPPPGQTAPNVPNRPATPGRTETVGYSVGGTGRAMSITYTDSDSVLQTEFNVSLPWSRQVELAQPANSSASVTVINFGRELTCSVTIAGRVVDHRTGSGLTICGAAK